MQAIDYIVVVLYFLGLVFVSGLVSRKIKTSEDMFIAGRNSSWWLSGLSTYMTIFSASTFVIWGGVAYRIGLVAALIGVLVGVSSAIAGRWVAGKWRQLKIKSPGEFLSIRFGKATLDFYTVAGIVGRGVHTAIALYAIAVVMNAIMPIDVRWAILLLGAITLIYTVAGGFPAVLMTDMIQFGVLFSVVLFMIPLSLHEVGGLGNFLHSPALPDGYFIPATTEYPWIWLVLWLALNSFQMGGDWPYVQRYISVPTAKDARKSNYLVAALYLFTPFIWYLPAMVWRTIDPAANPEQAYILMGQRVLMKGMLGVMLAAMVSATMSTVSGTLNVYANVFTYEIWGVNHPGETERKKIRIGRLFTLFFGLAIVAVALLVPYAGGAEKVVVPLLTMVMAPLCIPAVWGLFSRRISGAQVLWAMGITYAIGLPVKFIIKPAINPNLLDASIGLLIPVVLLTGMELWRAWRGRLSSGYERAWAQTDPEADKEPDAKMKKAVREYSHLALTCLASTLLAIGALLVIVMLTHPLEAAVRRIVLWTVGVIVLLCGLYFLFKYKDNNK